MQTSPSLILSPSRMMLRSRQFAVWHDIEASKRVFGTAGTGYEGRGPECTTESEEARLVLSSEENKKGGQRASQPAQMERYRIHKANKKSLSDNVH
jgi:hypothetical protein